MAVRPEGKLRLLAIATHPVQYMAPIFRRMAKHPHVELRVAYCSMRGAEAGHDPEFGREVKWDVPLLDGYEWVHVPNKGSGAETFWGLWNPGLWKLLREGNFDAVVSYVGYVRATFWLACFCANRSGIAFLFGTDAVSLVPRSGSSLKTAIKRFFWPLLFRLADQVFAPSSGTRDLLHALGLPAERVTLVPYVVDNDWWIDRSKQVDRAATRASWGVSPDNAVFVFSAKLQPWKRPLDLLHAFAKINISSAHLVIAGDGPLRAQLEKEAATLGVASRVHLLGFVNQSQLPTVYTASDLLVLPSGYEPFGLVVNEAMCCGCAVAASDRAGSARDLVAPVAPQFVFPCGDIDALASIMRNAANDRGGLQSIAHASLALIQTWSPERNIAGMVDAIRKAVNQVSPCTNLDDAAPAATSADQEGRRE